MAKQTPLPNKLKPWADARRQFRLSHAHVQMARELGLTVEIQVERVGVRVDSVDFRLDIRWRRCLAAHRAEEER